MPNVIRDDSLPLKRLQAVYSRIVSKPEFDKTLEDFVRTITVKPEYVDDIIAAIAELWRERQAKQLEANQQRLEYRQSLQG